MAKYSLIHPLAHFKCMEKSGLPTDICVFGKIDFWGLIVFIGILNLVVVRITSCLLNILL